MHPRGVRRRVPIVVALVCGLLVAIAAPASAAVTGDLYNVAFNTPQNVPAPGVLANDTNMIVVSSSPTSTVNGGAISLQSNGAFTYTPPTCFSGTDSFSYTALDANETPGTATVQLQVAAAPPATGCIPCIVGQACPVANQNSYSTPYGAQLNVAAPGPLANDRGASRISDYDTTSQNGGTVTLLATGALTYVPPASFSGEDIVEYTIEDGFGGSASTFVFISVSAVVANDTYAVPFNASFVRAAPGVLANDAGVVGVWDYDNETARGGAVDMEEDGSFTYTAAPCVTGADSFKYNGYASDGTTKAATVFLNIAARPSTSGCQPCAPGSFCPDAADDLYNTPGGATLSVGAPGVFDNDKGAAVLTGYDHASAAGGTVTLGTSGNLTFKPKSGFAGLDKFTYTIGDGLGGTATATVNVTVAPKISTPIITTAVKLTRTITVGFNKPASGVVQVQMRSADLTGPFSAWTRYKSALTGTSTSLANGAYGRTYCFQARVLETTGPLAGLASAWSTQQCQTVPALSTTFKYAAGSGWARTYSSLYWGGFGVRTIYKGASATRNIQAEAITLVVTKCPTCGSLAVYWRGALVKNVPLTASTTQRRVLVGVKTFSTAQTGTLKVVVTSANGRIVIIEGLAAFRD